MTTANREAPGLLESMWRMRLMTVLLVLGCVVAAIIFSALQTPRYVATSQIVLADRQSVDMLVAGGTSAPDVERTTLSQAELVESRRVLMRTAELLDGDIPIEELRDRVTTRPVPDVGMVEIDAAGRTGEQAALLADTVATAYTQVSRELVQGRADDALATIDERRDALEAALAAADQALVAAPDDASVQRERQGLAEELAALGTRASDVAVSASLFDAGVEYVEAALVPEEPEEPRPLRNVAAAALVGFLVAGPLAWVRLDRRRPVEHSVDAAATLGVRLLGEVPRFGNRGDLAYLHHLEAMPAEAYQVVTAALHYSLERGVVLVTSTAHGDGKTVAAANIAVAAARDGRRVALVDGDARAQGLSRLVGADPDEPGLADLALGNGVLEDCARRVPLSRDTSVTIVPAGRPVTDVASLHRTDGMALAVRALHDQFDLVIMDSPPLLAVSDTSSLAAYADGLLLVVDRGTPTPALEAVRQRLDILRTPTLGYVFNRGEAAPPYGLPPQPTAVSDVPLRSGEGLPPDPEPRWTARPVAPEPTDVGGGLERGPTATRGEAPGRSHGR